MIIEIHYTIAQKPSSGWKAHTLCFFSTNSTWVWGWRRTNDLWR